MATRGVGGPFLSFIYNTNSYGYLVNQLNLDFTSSISFAVIGPLTWSLSGAPAQILPMFANGVFFLT